MKLNDDSMIWMSGGALAISLLMVAGLVLLILVNGLGFFWPQDQVRLFLADGAPVMGEIAAREVIPQSEETTGGPAWRIQVKQGNRDLYGIDFAWFDEANITGRDYPPEAVVVERTEWGNFHGFLKAVHDGGEIVADGEQAAWPYYQARMPEIEQIRRQIKDIEENAIGAISYEQEQVRLAQRKLELAGITSGAEVDQLNAEMARLDAVYAVQTDQVARLREQLTLDLVLTTADQQEKIISFTDIIHIYRPNDMSFLDKSLLYVSNAWGFIWDDPRESNTEGGVFPAIFGTVMMVIIMSIIVTPLGILAAFYLREYARQGPFVSAVRIAVNNLAGVPSIVFGVFGIGFFIYFVGGTLDQLFYPERLPAPTYGTGGILWASLTLALMTVPVVIVATEEGLAAIPRGMRESSLALGATKFETTWRVVLPAVLPSILTGLILAMARAAGEVAPLMITGVVKLAPALPIDGFWPFVHLERKFMHLGFHIYDVGFQSPNVDAARPMVYTTTMLLLFIVVLLNLAAISLRSRLRRKYSVSSM